MDNSFLPKKGRRFFKFSLFCLSTLVSSFFFINVKAADGCYVSGVLYDAHTISGAYFYRTPNSPADCGIIGTISGSCRLYNSGNVNNNSSYTRYTNSYSTSISVVVCPIDDKLWIVLIAAACFSFFRFRLILCTTDNLR